MLSGDHLKEASDLGLPLVAVGFLYTYGYFSQRISEDGWQEARNIELNFDDLPLVALYDEDHHPIKISIELPGRELFARLYELNIGRNKLILMHTNLPENNPQDRQLTDRLYISCLLYTSDAADDLLCVDLGGRRIIKKKNTLKNHNIHPDK